MKMTEFNFYFEFIKILKPTIGIDFITKSVHIDNKIVKL